MKKSKYIALILIVLFLGFNTACEKRSDSKTGKSSEVTSQDVKKETKQALDAAARLMNQQKEAFQNQLEAKITEYDQKVDDLKAQANGLSGEA